MIFKKIHAYKYKLQLYLWGFSYFGSIGTNYITFFEKKKKQATHLFKIVNLNTKHDNHSIYDMMVIHKHRHMVIPLPSGT